MLSAFSFQMHFSLAWWIELVWAPYLLHWDVGNAVANLIEKYLAGSSHCIRVWGNMTGAVLTGIFFAFLLLGEHWPFYQVCDHEEPGAAVCEHFWLGPEENLYANGEGFSAQICAFQHISGLSQVAMWHSCARHWCSHCQAGWLLSPITTNLYYFLVAALFYGYYKLLKFKAIVAEHLVNTVLVSLLFLPDVSILPITHSAVTFPVIHKGG